jgi:NAD(P)-dependent dehydrogenase (short-subunit alcohol dehydrogenase family)
MDTPARTIVIGGSGYVGAAICRQLVRDGHAVVFTYCRNAAPARALAEELGVSALALDLAAEETIAPVLQKACEALGGLDALVIASGLATAHERAGQPLVPAWHEVAPDAFRRMLAVNVTGPFLACQWAAGRMAPQRRGRMVIIGSIDGVKPVPSPVDYACCKAALVGLVQSLAKDLGRHQILINLIAPGILDGGIAALLSPELHAEYVKHCTLKRVGTPAEIAAWAAFLIGTRNTYVTGQTVILDGGL